MTTQDPHAPRTLADLDGMIREYPEPLQCHILGYALALPPELVDGLYQLLCDLDSTLTDLLDKGAELKLGLELLAEELRLAQEALAAITGEFTADDLLGDPRRPRDDAVVRTVELSSPLAEADLRLGQSCLMRQPTVPNRLSATRFLWMRLWHAR